MFFDFIGVSDSVVNEVDVIEIKLFGLFLKEKIDWFIQLCNVFFLSFKYSTVHLRYLISFFLVIRH